MKVIMNTLLPMQLSSAIAIQTLALPVTLALCIISMLRERSIGDQDEKRLIRLYKQHAIVLEIVQFLVALTACGFIAGNTVAALEARSFVVGFTSEDVTAMIVRTALVRNLWLSVSAFCTLACMNMLDSWSLPRSFPDLTDPLFRLTRELVAACEYHSVARLLSPFWLTSDAGIWRHEASHQEDYSNPFFKDLERRCPSVDGPEPAPDEKSPATTKGEPSDKTATPLELPPRDEPEPKEEEIPAPPAIFSNTAKTSQEANPPPAILADPPASRPHYQAPTRASAQRIKPSLTPKTSTSSLSKPDRARKRSVTFALQPLSSEEDREQSREARKRSSSVRDRVRKLEMESSGVEERSTTLGKKIEVDAEKGASEEGEVTKSCEDEEMVIVDDSDATVVGSEVVEGGNKEH